MIRIRRKIREMESSSTLEITAKADALKAAGHKVIAFAAGQPDFPTPPHVCRAAEEAIRAGLTRYVPSAGFPELRAAVARYHSRRLGVELDSGNVVIGVGAKHALALFLQAVVSPGDEVIVPSPYWVSYPPMVTLASGKPVIVECGADTGYKLTAGMLEKAVTKRTRILILNSPSNPTGAVYGREEMKAVVKVALDRGLGILSDEIYEHLLYDGAEHVSPLSLEPGRLDSIAVVNGTSKTFSMTGWRVGWLVASKPVVKAVAKIVGQTTSSTATFAQKASAVAIESDMGFLRQWQEQYSLRRGALLTGIRSIPGLKPFVPSGAFYVWVDASALMAMRLPDGSAVGTSANLCKYLIDTEHVASVPGSAFGAEGHVRLSFATSLEDVNEGVVRIARAVGSLLPAV